MKGAQSLQLLGANPYVQNAGLKIIPNPIKVTLDVSMCYDLLQVAARRLPDIFVKYKNGELATSSGQWRTPNKAQYFHPAKCESWAIYAIQDNRRSNLDERTLR